MMKESKSNSRIILHNAICGNIGIPVCAGVLDVLIILESVNLRLPLDELQCESLSSVPCNVTWE